MAASQGSLALTSQIHSGSLSQLLLQYNLQSSAPSEAWWSKVQLSTAADWAPGEPTSWVQSADNDPCCGRPYLG